MKSLLISLLLLGAGLASGCTLQPVQPWQRGVLAQSEMAWDVDPLMATQRRQMQVSKEAASGGPTLGGGGCGCN
jgi:hypothetical protein